MPFQPLPGEVLVFTLEIVNINGTGAYYLDCPSRQLLAVTCPVVFTDPEGDVNQFTMLDNDTMVWTYFDPESGEEKHISTGSVKLHQAHTGGGANTDTISAEFDGVTHTSVLDAEGRRQLEDCWILESAAGPTGDGCCHEHYCHNIDESSLDSFSTALFVIGGLLCCVPVCVAGYMYKRAKGRGRAAADKRTSESDTIPMLPMNVACLERQTMTVTKKDGKVGAQITGTRVNKVTPGGAAELAGLRPSMIVVMIDGKDVPSQEDILRLLTTAPNTFKITVAVPKERSSRTSSREKEGKDNAKDVEQGAAPKSPTQNDISPTSFTKPPQGANRTGASVNDAVAFVKSPTGVNKGRENRSLAIGASQSPKAALPRHLRGGTSTEAPRRHGGSESRRSIVRSGKEKEMDGKEGGASGTPTAKVTVPAVPAVTAVPDEGRARGASVPVGQDAGGTPKATTPRRPRVNTVKPGGKGVPCGSKPAGKKPISPGKSGRSKTTTTSPRGAVDADQITQQV